MGFVVAATSVFRASRLEGDLRVDLSSNFLQRVQRFLFWRQLCCRSGGVWQSHLMDGVCGSGVINDGGCRIVSHTQRDGERDVVVLVLRDAGVRDGSCCFRHEDMTVRMVLARAPLYTDQRTCSTQSFCWIYQVYQLDQDHARSASQVTDFQTRVSVL